ncbi:ATP-binding protein [Roseateles sp. BYS87W]|uniref:ATP-binding protein n=1 Tax=Pelomonas baiyunensis TaxID=3299026 RepID=A0ABW7H1X8_9BURK
MTGRAEAVAPATPAALVLSLLCELASCAVAHEALHALLAPHQPSARAMFGLDVVLEELLMNQILHAHPPEVERATVQLQAWVVHDALVLRLTDRGIAFDPLARPTPVAPATLDEARPGGWGIHLLRRYARALAYERVGEANQLTVELALR